MRVHVIHTGPRETRCALDAAGRFGSSLNLSVQLLVAHVVPYPLPLNEPDIPFRFTRRNLLEMLKGQEVEIEVRVWLCRDRESAVRDALPPRSLVIIGGRAKWRFWDRARRLARKLRRDGHRVIFIDTRNNPGAREREARQDHSHEFLDCIN